MAITKIWSVKTRIDASLAYVMNPQKTQGKLLVSAYRCGSETAELDFFFTREYCKAHEKMNRENIGGAEIMAYHMIQNFSERDSITAEQAHEIGEKWAHSVLGDDYQFVIATHIDKGRPHNHIIFNPYSMENPNKKYRTVPYKSAQELRQKSDALCREYGLEIIENPQGVGRKYKELNERRRGQSWKAQIQAAIDKALSDLDSYSYENFTDALHGLGVEMDDGGKFIKYRIEGQEKWSRANGKSLPVAYNHEGLADRIFANAGGRVKPVTINQKLYSGFIEDKAEHYTRIPYTNEFFSVPVDMGHWYKGQRTFCLYIDENQSYTLFNGKGKVTRTVEGMELLEYYQQRSGKSVPIETGEPARAGAAGQDQRGALDEAGQEQEPARAATFQVRGGLAYYRGVPLPLDVRAMYYVRAQRAENIRDMAQALKVMHREGIKAMQDFDVRLGECQGEINRINHDTIEPLIQAKDKAQEVLRDVDVYRKYAPQAQAIEQAPPLRQRQLKEKYSLEIQAFESAAARIRQRGIDPGDMTTETVAGQVKEIQNRINQAQGKRGEIAGRVGELRQSQETIKRVFQQHAKEPQRRERRRGPEK